MPTESPDAATAVDYINDHLISQRLRTFGWTQAELQVCGFRSHSAELPFSQWSLRAPGHRTPSTKEWLLLRGNAALRWLMIDDPAPGRDRDEAWQCIAIAVGDEADEIADRHRKTQSDRAKAPRGRIDADGTTIGDVVAELVLAPQYIESSASELWPHLFAKLDSLDLDPKMADNDRSPRRSLINFTIWNGRSRRISRATFENLVSKARRSSR